MLKAMFFKYYNQHVRKSKPDMLVIMKTRCNPSKLAKSVNTMGFDGIVVAENEGYA